jgi:hypothetical protein
MMNQLKCTAVLLLMFLGAFAAPLFAQGKKSVWKPLMDGKTLAGWHKVGDGREEDVPALSGKAVTAGHARYIEIDGVLRIRGTLPLRPVYFGAARPSRSQATDELYRNYLSSERDWRAGETISEYEATVHCSPGESK